MRCSFPVLCWIVLQWQHTNGDGNKEPCSVSIKNKLHHYWRRTGKIALVFAIKLLQLFTLSVWRGARPTPSRSDGTFIFINDSPCTLLFYVVYVFFQLTFLLVSQLFSCWRPVTDANGQHYHNVFPPLSLDKRGRYRNYIDSRHSAGYWPFVRFWLLFIDF